MQKLRFSLPNIPLSSLVTIRNSEAYSDGTFPDPLVCDSISSKAEPVMTKLNDARALVTGGTSGLGRVNWHSRHWCLRERRAKIGSDTGDLPDTGRPREPLREDFAMTSDGTATKEETDCSSMANEVAAVYGASGHTGRFVAAELVRRGISPLLCGRDERKLDAVAKKTPGSEVRVALLDDPASVDRALDGALAVINCAGPYLLRRS